MYSSRQPVNKTMESQMYTSLTKEPGVLERMKSAIEHNANDTIRNQFTKI